MSIVLVFEISFFGREKIRHVVVLALQISSVATQAVASLFREKDTDVQKWMLGRAPPLPFLFIWKTWFRVHFMDVDANVEKIAKMIDTYTFKMECERPFHGPHNRFFLQTGFVLFFY